MAKLLELGYRDTRFLKEINTDNQIGRYQIEANSKTRDIYLLDTVTENTYISKSTKGDHGAWELSREVGQRLKRRINRQGAI